MRVNVYDHDQNTGEESLQARNVDLEECFPNDRVAYYTAREELERAGRYWVGGGAAPLVLLLRIP
jgi:hypothetical protein